MKQVFSAVAKAGLLIGIGGVLGWWVGTRAFPGTPTDFHALRSPNGGFKYINPLIGFDVLEQKNFNEFKPLKYEIAGIIDRAEADSGVDLVSVYYRNPDNGHWMGINENEVYLPASLLKVPIMVAYFKKAESEPGVLRERVFVNAPSDTAPESPNNLPSKLVPGQTYTTEELIAAMIKDSDNQAKDLLLRNIDASSLEEVFSDLGVEIPPRRGSEYGISAKTYSMFFRTLYSATYLNRAMSEKALSLLASASFHDGIVRGVPAGTMVAHKYGERGIVIGSTIAGIDFHDCGMVYFPRHPYLLCVMTRGKNIADLEKIVQDISAAVWSQESHVASGR